MFEIYTRALNVLKHRSVEDGYCVAMEEINQRRAEFYQPVSYTHLDVYKRQGMNQMMADIASMGGELFVMDDGWFGDKYPRRTDKTSLGDWVENLHDIETPGVKARSTVVPVPYRTNS